MKDYCTCGLRRIEQTFLNGGVIYCEDCRQPLCCDVVTKHHSPAEPHPAEVRDAESFGCWRHWDSVADLGVSHSFSRQGSLA